MDVVFISYLVAIAVSFAVGAPTLVRALRAHDTPLALLGAAVSFDALEPYFDHAARRRSVSR